MSHSPSTQLSQTDYDGFITPSTTPPHTQSPVSDQQRFEELWSVRSRYQRAMLCALNVSTGGIWLASSSLDSNMVFIDFKTGRLIGVLDFESRFHVTSILWVSDSLLYAGCNNGVLFAVNYSPTSKYPIAMHPVLKPFNAPITALALDPIRNFLAVGSSGDAFIFSRPVYGDIDSWDFIDHVPAPSDERHGLITSLGFYGTSMKDRQLFIGYAKEGFCIWHDPLDFQRTPYGTDDAVCSIGSAALSSDGRFIAIVTLDHSIVLYPLTPNGLAIHERRVLQNQEQSGPRPIVPIALAADNLVLRGTVSGTVPIIDLQHGPLAPIQNGPKEVIRALTAYGDKVIIGVSDTAGRASQIKCYLDLTSPTPARARSPTGTDRPIFEIAIGELEEQAGSYRTLDGLRFRKFDQLCKSLAARLFGGLALRLKSRRTWNMIGFIWVSSIILFMDPPALPGSVNDSFNAHRQATSTAVSHHQARPNARTEYPTLGYLFSYCGWYVASRCMWWGAWLVACLFFLLGQGLKTLVWIAAIVPYITRMAITVVPSFLSAAICDVLQAYGDVPVCPRVSK